MKKYIDEEGHEVQVWEDGSKRWLKNGELHRDDDKPAVVFKDGMKVWFKNGKRHRDNGKPGAVWKDGVKIWFKNDQFHRENNPAIISKTPQNANFYHLHGGRVLLEKHYWIRLLLLEY